MANDVRIGVGVKDTASSALDKIRDKFDQLGASKGAQSILMGVGLAAGQMAFNALGRAASAAGDLITGSVDAAKQQEVASAKLDQALRNNGSSYAANADAIEEVTRKGVDLGFNDDLITDGMARLVSATGSVSKAAYAMGIAQDLARLKGISLEEATLALTSIEGGRFRALATLGIVLQKGATVEDALSAVRAKASGQAEAFAKTETGAWDRVGAKWDQAQEQLGNALMPILTDLGTLIGDNMPQWLESFGRGWDKATTAIKFVIEPLFFVARAVQNMRAEIASTGSILDDTGNGFNSLGVRVDATARIFGGVPAPVAAASVTLMNAGLSAAWAAARHREGSRGVTEFADASAAATLPVQTLGDAVLTTARETVDSMAKMATSVRATRDAIVAAVNQVIDNSYDPLINAAELTAAKLTLADDQKALSSKKLTKTQQAELKVQILNDEKHIAELKAAQLGWGTDQSQIVKLNGALAALALDKGWKSGDAQTVADLKVTKKKITDQLALLKVPAEHYGGSTGRGYSAGIASGINSGYWPISRAIARIGGLLKASSPPGPESPLHEIDKWGERTTGSWVDGMVKGLGGAKSGVSGALAGLAPAFAGGGGSGGGFSGGGGAGGGGGVIVNVSYSPQLSTATPGEMDRAARVLGPAIVRELRGRGLVPQGSY